MELMAARFAWAGLSQMRSPWTFPILSSATSLPRWLVTSLPAGRSTLWVMATERKKTHHPVFALSVPDLLANRSYSAQENPPKTRAKEGKENPSAP